MSKYYRRCVLTKFDKCYNIITGFSALELWATKMQGNLWGLIDNIFNDITAEFDPKGYYQLLFKEFRHLPLFSVCLHFLRCQRSCENYAGYCRLCSRVKDYSFLELNTFLSIKVSDGYLGLNHYENVDFDVFLTRPAYFWCDFVETDRKCF